MLRLTDIALGAGAVLAVALGVFALRPDAVPDPGPAPTRTTSSASATPEVKPSVTVSAAPTPAATVATVTGWVVGAGNDLVVRAPQRDCDDTGSTSVTVLGAEGKAVTRDVPGLRAVGGLRVDGRRSVVLVGVDAECKRVGFGTTDRGRTWTALDKVPAFWSVIPGNDQEVHAPSGQVTVPCAARSVTGLDDKVARLACADGRLLGTVTGGAEWSILGNKPGLVAVGFISSGAAIALVEEKGCAGIQVVASTNGGTGFSPSYCAEGAGPWGLVTGKGTAVVTGLDAVFRSTDGGKSWAVTKVVA